MEVIFEPDALEDIEYFKLAGDQSILKKIRQLIENMKETPFEGLGKPEPLKHQLSGKWSRRISGEHRLVYRVENDQIVIYQLRYHY